jgi:biopolymer transport protein ExbD
MKRRRRPELPLVPLIDVLVLIVFFTFVTMRFVSTQTLNLTLPKADTAGKNQLDPKGVAITIQKDGSIYYNGKKTTEEELLQMLLQVKEISREIPVLISADQDTPIKTVTFVMDACRKAALNRFSLQTQ